MLSRLPWTPLPETVIKRKAKAKPRRLNKDRRRHLVDTVVVIMRRSHSKGAPSKFSFEAACRHSIRSRLCLKGWGWNEADTIAAEIVAAALNRISARRPSWKEGQPEWSQDGFAPIARLYCVRCGTRLPEGHHKFCSPLCGDAHKMTLRRIREAEEWHAYDLVVAGAKWLVKTCD